MAMAAGDYRLRSSEMKRAGSVSFILFLISFLLPGITCAVESLQKIRVGLPSLALTYMPFYVAQEKGLLKKAGLEAEYIQMNTGIQPQAIIAGNINFFPVSIDWDFRRGGRSAAGCRTQLLRDYAVDARDHQGN
jgi:ABC-type nitrate/sulfonate/bicarbonate transport system substrate-binding protein